MGSVSSTAVVVYVCCGVLPLLLVPHLLSQRRKPGATGLLATTFGLSLWSLSAGAMHVTAGYWSRLLAMSVFFVGVAFGGVGYLALAAEYSGVFAVTWRKFAPLAGPVLGVLALAWTDRAHGLLWDGAVPGNANLASPGATYFAYVLFIVAVAGAGSVIIAREAVVDDGVRRLQGIVLLGAGLPPLVLGALGAFVFPGLAVPLAPLSLVASVFFYAWALFRADFLEVGLVGRHRMVEALDDGIVTLDAEGRVADANPAARRIAGVEDRAHGLTMAEFFADLPEVLAALEGGGGVDTELAVAADGAERHYHLDASPIQRGNRSAGRLIVLRDITRLKRRERTLAEREGELDLLRQVLSRVLRHNIRNDLSVIRGYAELVATDPNADHEALAAGIVRRCDDLTDLSEKAATIERLVAEDDAAERTQLAPLLESIVDGHRTRYPNVAFELDTADARPLEVDGSLAFAFENLIENAAEHGSATAPSVPNEAAARGSASTNAPGDTAEPGSAAPGSDPEGDTAAGADPPLARGESSDSLFTPPDDAEPAATVRIAVEPDESGTTVTVADDGPGIPDHELEVLRRGKETPLEHGSGIGLWIVYWIGEHTDVSISFDTGDDGTLAAVEIPA